MIYSNGPKTARFIKKSLNLASTVSDTGVANLYSKKAYGFACRVRKRLFTAPSPLQGFVAFVLADTPPTHAHRCARTDKVSPYPASPIPYTCVRTPLDLLAISMPRPASFAPHGAAHFIALLFTLCQAPRQIFFLPGTRTPVWLPKPPWSAKKAARPVTSDGLRTRLMLYD